MNKKTAYELTITGKLQQLPLPDDMEDVIWARIKTQLDDEMSTDDDGGGAPDAPSGGGWGWGAGSFFFVAALTALFFLTKKQTPALPESQPPVLPTTLQTATPPGTVEQSSDPPQALPAGPNDPPPVQPTGDLPLVNGPVTTPLTGAAPVSPVAGWPLPDSLRQTTVLTRPPLVPDTVATRKKTRGVTGITDSDYRIVPEKDSM